mmetsp:Transcript_123494/g.349048  ORF Transcript_123494/g.349048 Transcript_123494/m.349048 type:complete len:569 (+) Transcript_123494:39-1745(+)
MGATRRWTLLAALFSACVLLAYWWGLNSGGSNFLRSYTGKGQHDDAQTAVTPVITKVIGVELEDDASGGGSRSCPEFDREYTPFMPSTPRTVECAWSGCQSRCLRTAGCAHFSSYPDGGCHLSSSGATPRWTSGATSGPPGRSVGCARPDQMKDDAKKRFHVVAELTDLGSMRLPDDGPCWQLLSAIPVVGGRHDTLVLIWEWKSAPHSWALAEGKKTRPAYFLQLASGVTTKVDMYTNVNLYSSNILWYANFDKARAEAWGTRGSRCVAFSILDVQLEVVLQAEACDNTTSLPTVKAPTELAICYGVPPFHNQANLAMSGYLNVAQNILYHMHHGVDTFVFYLVPEFSVWMESTLRYFVERGVLSLVVFPLSKSRRGQDMYKLQTWAENDCLARLKYRAKIMKQQDYDEFLYAESWRSTGKRSPVLQSVQRIMTKNFDAYTVNCFLWEMPQDFLRDFLITTNNHTDTITPYFGKTFVRPERIAVGWVHAPTYCFHPQGTCNIAHDDRIKYAHVVTNEKRNAVLKKDLKHARWMSDDLLKSEVPDVLAEFCRWMAAQGRRCEPRSFLP